MRVSAGMNRTLRRELDERRKKAMREDIDVSGIDLAEDYTEHLKEIGRAFLRSFSKRQSALPIHIQIVCGISDYESILKKKPYLSSVRDDFGRVPLMVFYHSFIYATLLQCGADPNARDINGNTVLMYHRRHPEIVEELVNAGADINATNNAGVSLVMMALEEGLPVYPFVRLGASLPSIPRDRTDRVFLDRLPKEPVEVLSGLFSGSLPSEDAYLHAKIWSGCLDREKYEWLKTLEKRYSGKRKTHFSTNEEELFEKELKSRICGKESALFEELIENMDECLKSRASIRACIRRDKTILAGVSNLTVLKFLLRAGADPNLGRDWKENTDSSTPLFDAVCRRDRKAVELLLAHGADPNTGTTYQDEDVTCIGRAIKDNELEILRLLVKAGADPDFALRCTGTPVITAIRNDNLAALKMLVRGGADPCLADPFGRVPLDYLKESNSPELCKYIKAAVARHKRKTDHA